MLAILFKARNCLREALLGYTSGISFKFPVAVDQRSAVVCGVSGLFIMSPSLVLFVDDKDSFVSFPVKCSTIWWLFLAGCFGTLSKLALLQDQLECESS